MSTSLAESLPNAATRGAGSAPGTGAPQAPQKAKPGWILAPHAVHWIASGGPAGAAFAGAGA
jgi:hypothetical protein